MNNFFTTIPAGFSRHFGEEHPSLPKACVVCGGNASDAFKITRRRNLDHRFTLDKLSVLSPVCRKHFIQITLLRYLYWILLLGTLTAAFSSRTAVHYIIIAAFPFVAILYFQAKNSVSIYKAIKLNGVAEIILSIKRQDYYEKVTRLAGVVPIPFPEPPRRLLIKRLLLMTLCFMPWAVFAILTTYNTLHVQDIEWERLNKEIMSLSRQGNYDRAVISARKALGIAEKIAGSNSPNVAESLNNLAGLYRSQGQYAQAEPLYKRSLAIWEKTLGPDHPDVATSLNNLAGLYMKQGQFALAEPLYKRSLAIWEKTLGSDHPNVATSLNNLAELYHDQGQYAQAEPLYKRSLAIWEKTLGPDHPNVAASLNNLAELYRNQGQYTESEPLYKRSLAIMEKALGPDHPNVATSLDNLAGLYDTQGQYAQAEPLYKRSLEIRETALGPDHSDVATSLNNLALLYRTQGQYALAEPIFKRALAIWEKTLGPDHPNVASKPEQPCGALHETRPVRSGGTAL